MVDIGRVSGLKIAAELGILLGDLLSTEMRFSKLRYASEIISWMDLTDVYSPETQ